MAMVGPCRDWVASAVVDWGLRVAWRPEFGGEAAAERARAGVAVLPKSGWVPADDLAGWAESWVCLLDLPGWGGRRYQKLAAQQMATVPGVRFVPLPGGEWIARAAAANVQTRESLTEILGALGYPIALERLKARAG